MNGRNGLIACMAGMIGFAGSGLVAAGDNMCHSAPRCWKYHQDVCFGYYQTKWRRWDEACGKQTRPFEVVPQFSVSTPIDLPQPASLGTPKPLPAVSASAVKKAVEEAPPRTSEHSPPPAARLAPPLPLAGTLGVGR